MYNTKHQISNRTYINYLFLLWLSLIELIKISTRFKSDVILICSDEDRGDEREGKAYSKIIDSLQDDLRNKAYKVSQIAHLGSNMTGKKAWGNPLSINHIVYLSELIDDKFKMDNSFVEKVYKSVFSILKPRLVLAIGATDIQCSTIKNMGIPIVEVLHGLGYHRINWGLDTKEEKYLPSHILSFDTKSTKTFSPLQKRGVNIIESKHPWYKRFQKNEVGVIQSFPGWIREASFIPTNKKIVLISLTWGYVGEKEMFKNILEDGLMPNDLKKVIKNTKDEIFYCIRRHPVQVRNKKYEYQVKYLDDFVIEHPNCEWRKSTNYPLISILKHCDAHITMISMTAYDAALFGIKSLLLCPTLHGINSDKFTDLINDGYALKNINGEDNITKWLHKSDKIVPYNLTENTVNGWVELLKSSLNN